jgi:hypothetical protein
MTRQHLNDGVSARSQPGGVHPQRSPAGFVLSVFFERLRSWLSATDAHVLEAHIAQAGGVEQVFGIDD